jgi:hypothetical protein
LASQQLRSGGGSPTGPTRPPDRIQCPGCHRVVDIARPLDIPFAVKRANGTGPEMITITVGLVVVHRCLLCADGEWR